jgi:hypothetical protein
MPILAKHVMPFLMERYRRENNILCIDVRFHEFKQLYDGRDPSPFYERDLDEDLVRYLVMSCEEIAHDEPIKIVMNEVQPISILQQKEDFVQALHSYFEHEVRSTDNELKYLFRQGRTSLAFGLSFLILCVFFAIKFFGDVAVMSRIIHEGLIIIGWVALWKPINIFLYEWWPFLRKKRVYKLLSTIKIEFK